MDGISRCATWARDSNWSFFYLQEVQIDTLVSPEPSNNCTQVDNQRLEIHTGSGDPLAGFIRKDLYTENIPVQLQNGARTHTHTRQNLKSKHQNFHHTHRQQKKKKKKSSLLTLQFDLFGSCVGYWWALGNVHSSSSNANSETQLFSTGNLVKGCASIRVCVSQPWCEREAGTFSSCCGPYLPNRGNHRPATA